MKPKLPEKRYLGDSVYASFDGAYILLTLENGIEASARIYLEPEVYARLAEYIARVETFNKEQEYVFPD